MAYNYAAQSSPSEIITTFNGFFAAIPLNKSFDMTYKAYIQDLADSEDRNNPARLHSTSRLSGPRSSRLAHHGVLGRRTTPTASSADRLTLKSGSSISNLHFDTSSKVPRFSTTSLRRSSSSTFSIDDELNSGDKESKVSMTQIDNIYKNSLNRKQRSMVNLTELNKKLGLQFVEPPRSAPKPDTVYENLKKVPIASPVLSTFNCKPGEFSRVIQTEPRGDKNFGVFIKVADCFD